MSNPITLTVMCSGGFAEAYKGLIPDYQQATGNQLHSIWGPSMGQSAEAIPNRLHQGEYADVVIMVGYALDELIKKGQVLADSKVDLADSRIGMVVKQGEAKPDISTVEQFTSTLQNAKSIAYSDSASGTYIENELFEKLGIEDSVQPKAKMIEKTPVGEKVASGEFELGFQQVSELLPVKGVDFVARIPNEVQSITTFSAGVVATSKHPEQAKALIEFLTNDQSDIEVARSGMDVIN